MIKFNKLSIDKEDTTLSIDVSVLTDPIYATVYIDKITVEDHNNTVAYSTTVEGDAKTFSKELSAINMSTSIKGTLFLVTVTTKGAPTTNVPCGGDNVNTTEAVYNTYPIYKKSICYMRELVNTCDSHSGFSDYILKSTALDLAIKTKDYVNAKDFWSRYFANLKDVEPIKKCNCNG